MLAMDVWCFSKSTARIDLEKHQTRLHYWGISLCNFGESPLQFWVFLLYTKHPDSPEPDLVEVEKHLRKRKYAGQREELVKNIPHSKVLHAMDEREQICEKCGSTMVKVGEEFVRTEVQFIPAKLKVIDHYRETYECRSCRKKGTPYMEKAPVPYPPVMHSLASASTLAWLIHQKFELGIPLYRQEKEWEALGLRLSRATMSNWLLVVYRDWLQHIVHRLRKELLKQGYLHIDETHVDCVNSFSQN